MGEILRAHLAELVEFHDKVATEVRVGGSWKVCVLAGKKRGDQNLKLVFSTVDPDVAFDMQKKLDEAIEVLQSEKEKMRRLRKKGGKKNDQKRKSLPKMESNKRI